MLTFTIPGLPPSKSNSYRSGGGKFWKNAKVAQYERDFAFYTTSVKKHTFNPTDRLSVSIIWYPPHLKSDTDGICKVILDMCQKTGIIWNDNKVDDPHPIRADVDKVNPRVEIYIKTLTKAEKDVIIKSIRDRFKA